jgi:hypothetical protein
VWSGLQHTATAAGRIGATLPLLPPDGAIGGWAAAYLAGVPACDGLTLDGEALPVDHVVPPAHRLRPRAGIRVRREQLPHDLKRALGRRSVTAPARTALDVARWATSVEEAVCALDAMFHVRYADPQDVAALIQATTRRPGLPQARRALQLADARSRSPRETQLRLLWVVGAGLPPLLSNVPVWTTSGVFLGQPDLLDAEAGLAMEHDGAQHRDLANHTADNAREERLERAGLRVIRFTILDLRDRAGCVRRMRMERARRLGRDTSRETWWVDPRDLGAA